MKAGNFYWSTENPFDSIQFRNNIKINPQASLIVFKCSHVAYSKAASLTIGMWFTKICCSFVALKIRLWCTRTCLWMHYILQLSVQKYIYMDFEIITPNNDYDDEVNPNYMNASKIVTIQIDALCMHIQMKVKLTQTPLELDAFRKCHFNQVNLHVWNRRTMH